MLRLKPSTLLICLVLPLRSRQNIFLLPLLNLPWFLRTNRTVSMSVFPLVLISNHSSLIMDI